MKQILNLLFALLISNAYSQSFPQEHEWTATLKTIDDNLLPITDAKVRVDYSVYKGPIFGVTDTNGVFIASHVDATENLGIHAEKNGYYSFVKEYHKGSYNPERWNPSMSLLLRKIGSPIPMFAKREEAKFPKLDEPVGFDLMVGDWVTPFGKGFHGDVYFTLHRKIVDDSAFDCSLIVTFANKGDGIVTAPFEKVTGSDFKTPRTAVENGYQPELVLHFSNTNQPESIFGYFIRVHTDLDKDGKIKSALYGKFAGNLRFYAGTKAPTSGLGFDYYLNPTPNDFNVEFNPKRNLVKDLKPLQEVKDP